MTTDGKPKNMDWVRKGEDAPRAKLTADEVRAIRADIADGATVHATARKFRISPSNVSSIKSGKIWRSIL